MYSTPSGQAIAMSTNEPNRTATDIVLNRRITPSGPSPTALFDDELAVVAEPVVEPPVLVGGVVVAVGAAVVVGASVATVNLNEPSPPGVPSWLLTFQLTTHGPFGSTVVTGTVS